MSIELWLCLFVSVCVFPGFSQLSAILCEPPCTAFFCFNLNLFLLFLFLFYHYRTCIPRTTSTPIWPTFASGSTRSGCASQVVRRLTGITPCFFPGKSLTEFNQKEKEREREIKGKCFFHLVSLARSHFTEERKESTVSLGCLKIESSSTRARLQQRQQQQIICLIKCRWQWQQVSSRQWRFHLPSDSDWRLGKWKGMLMELLLPKCCCCEIFSQRVGETVWSALEVELQFCAHSA